MTRELTAEDKRRGFLYCTSRMEGAEERWKQRTATGLTDEQLAKAIAYELGLEGGGSSMWDDVPAHHVKGAGLQIWLNWDFPRCHQERPTFKGAESIAMARAVYGIGDPSKPQLDLFGVDQ